MSLPSTPTTEADVAHQPDVVMYTTTWCGYCKRLKRQMQDAGIDFAEVDIEEQPETAAIVERVNQGNQTVPTLVFRDGSALTNPSIAQVTAQIAAAAS